MNKRPRPASAGKVALAPWRKLHIPTVTCSIALFLALGLPATAAEEAETRNNYGALGLIDMPDARMAPDGTLAAGASFLRNNQHYTITFQALPWLEADFRYSGLEKFDPTYPVYYDRSFAMKARLWDETDLLPAVAIGINDLVGTGVYAGEYMVASKRVGPFDATLGIGWDRLATTQLLRNPFISLSQSFARRDSVVLHSPGSANLSSFFHGEYAGLFGGVVWHTPIDRLSLIGEYSSDTYLPERFDGDLTVRGQMNYGVSYQVMDDVTMELAWMYNTTLSGNVSFALDPTTDAFPQHINDPPLPPVHLRSQADQQQALEAMNRQRDPNANSAVIFSSSGLNSLTDALFAEIGGLRDVSIRGTMLVVTAGSGDLRAVCAGAAATVARYNGDFRIVEANNGARKSARCDVVRRGAGVLVNASMSQNPAYNNFRQTRLVSAALLTIDASGAASPDRRNAAEKIKQDAEKQRLVIQAVSLTDDEAIVYYSNLRYGHESEAVKRLVRVLMADAPPNIEKFRMIPTAVSVPQAEFDVLRGPTEREISQTGSYSLLDHGNALTEAPLQNPVLTASTRGTYPQFAWTVFPQFRQELFDPNNPFAVQFLGAVQGVAEVWPGLSAVGEAEASIYDNFNTHRDAGSYLPHVRTDWTRFFTEGKNGVGQFELDYLTRLAPDVFAQARVGYLESMYAGVGGEVLWRPEDQRWAIGADLYGVEERDFNRLFGLQGYTTITGHATLYYASPWYGVNVALRVGQYLARDRGFTLEMTRRFSTGVEVGVFFTKTNVSALQFGEGSFDKGFIIRIPLDWTMPVTTQSSFSTIIRPVQRDGGQALEGDANLYGFLQRTGTADVLAHADDFVAAGADDAQ